MNASAVIARWAFILAILAIMTNSILAAPAASAPAEEGSAVGKWNLTVDTGKDTHPAWLAVDRQVGKYLGRYLGGAGAVHDIGEVKVEGATVQFNAEESKW
ncbi:MAG: hypothetical protein V1755_13580, partial [Chloroflexota bacterium]